MTDSEPPRRRARVSTFTRAKAVLDPDERDAWARRFEVAPTQIDHDFVVSHLLAALSAHRDRFTFYGGTALSRTFLPALRLSEDVDLLSVGPRRDVASLLDSAVRDYMEPKFGTITADPWLTAVSVDTQSCVFQVARTKIRVQLIDGRDYPRWPTQQTWIEQRYVGIPATQLQTYTALSFVGAKTCAWAETTRNAPRDLYDLWALARAGHINADAARLFRKYGPTGGYPERWLLPDRPPTEAEWQAALRNQCIPLASAADAYETVITSWAKAIAEASENS